MTMPVIARTPYIVKKAVVLHVLAHSLRIIRYRITVKSIAFKERPNIMKTMFREIIPFHCAVVVLLTPVSQQSKTTGCTDILAERPLSPFAKQK